MTYLTYADDLEKIKKSTHKHRCYVFLRCRFGEFQSQHCSTVKLRINKKKKRNLLLDLPGRSWWKSRCRASRSVGCACSPGTTRRPLRTAAGAAHRPPPLAGSSGPGPRRCRAGRPPRGRCRCGARNYAVGREFLPEKKSNQKGTVLGVGGGFGI